ncbi:hypothetical protein FACS1894167_08490 [Synergistales bacterium]|nr:hypothetical protein FACS1894167_08490 [Synergistales bacterium]
MKKVLFAVLMFGILAGFGIGARSAAANELDDKRVADLFSVAAKVRSYGDYCWEVKFTGEWETPGVSLEKSDFNLYVMELSVLNRPQGDFNYEDFKKQFARIRRKFNAGESALVACVPAEISFNEYKDAIFTPWVKMSHAGESKNWLFIKSGANVYAKPKWRIYCYWLTGPKAIRDFICYGADDHNAVKVEGNSITFTTRDEISFKPDVVKKFYELAESGKEPFLTQFFTQWKDDSGESIVGRVLEAGKTYTLNFTGGVKMPEGW